jgi:hypothetical protein
LEVAVHRAAPTAGLRLSEATPSHGRRRQPGAGAVVGAGD